MPLSRLTVIRPLLDWARQGAPLRGSVLHGERHWAGVAAMGLVLARNSPLIDPRLVLAFAITHDCRRFDEYDDPHHGERAARALAELPYLTAFLDPKSVSDLLTACTVHTGAPDGVEHGFSVSACLDADRFNLLRLGSNLRRARFSLPYSDQAFEKAGSLATRIVDDAPGWGDVGKYYEERFSTSHPLS